MRMCLILAGVMAGGSTVLGQLDHDGDIGLKIVNDRLRSGRVLETPAGEFVKTGPRVFGAEFQDMFGLVTTDEPGLFGEPGNFPTTILRFDVPNPIVMWDGSTLSTPTASTITIEFGPNSATTGPGAISGFGIPVGPAGFDEHYEFFLNTPAVGIYLLELDFSVDAPGVIPADTVFVVFNHGLSEIEHEAAIDWVREHRVPAPGPILCMGGLAWLAARRRQRTIQA